MTVNDLAELPEPRQLADVVVAGRECDADGVEFERLTVDDPSYSSTWRLAVESVSDEQDRLLLEHPEWKPPRVVKGVLDESSLNPVSEWFYSGHPDLIAWRESAPSALTLNNIYFPEALRLVGDPLTGTRLFSGHPVSSWMQALFVNLLDGIGVRSRARTLQMVAREHVLGRPFRWISLASGAAIPVLDSLAASAAGAELALVDIDARSLAFARRLAEHPRYARGETVRTHERNLITGLIMGDALVDELGSASADLVDMIGIFEYFRTERAVSLLRNSWRLVKPGGTLVLANMLTTRRQLEFNVRGVGWPHLIPRSLAQVHAIVDEAIGSNSRVRTLVPEDGVYAVFAISK
jgi:SAM-dependent methyltransferase